MHDAAGQPVGQRLARRVEERGVDDDEPQVVERRRVGAPGDARERGHDAQAEHGGDVRQAHRAVRPRDLESISAPQATANAAITATAHSGSIIEPGRASVSSRVTAPLSHSTPLTRLASASLAGAGERARGPTTTSARAVTARAPPRPYAPDRPDRIISAAPPGTRRSSGRRRSRAASRCRSAGSRAPRRRAAMTSPVWAPPRRIAERVAARTSRRRRSSSSVLSPPAGRRGSRRARHRISSASRLPTPDDHGLVHEPRLQRRGPAAHARAELVARDLGGVGADGGEVGLQARAAQPALVAQGEPAAVLEVHDEAVPAAGRRLLVDRDAPGHAEVQARAPARRRRSRPTSPCRGGARRSARGRRARRRSRPGRAGGRRRCRRRRRRRCAGAERRARSSRGRAQPPEAQAS